VKKFSKIRKRNPILCSTSSKWQEVIFWRRCLGEMLHSTPFRCGLLVCRPQIERYKLNFWVLLHFHFILCGGHSQGKGVFIVYTVHVDWQMEVSSKPPSPCCIKDHQAKQELQTRQQERWAGQESDAIIKGGVYRSFALCKTELRQPVPGTPPTPSCQSPRLASCTSVTRLQYCMAEGGDGWLSPSSLLLIGIRTYLPGTNKAPSTIQYTATVTGSEVTQPFHLPQRELRVFLVEAE
jgi:hypothetical protein